VVLHQVYATFIIAQVVLALRTEIAQRAGVDLRDISMELLIRWLPRLAAMGHDPVEEFVARGRNAGYIRPYRAKAWDVPKIAESEYSLLESPPDPRKARYGSRAYNARTYIPSAKKQQKRSRYWDFELCRRTV
jgi:hypothetical protein